MIRLEVRSINGRPSASTPVTTRGTACTMRVLRRLRSSVLALVMPSDTISGELSARSLPNSSMWGCRRAEYPYRFLYLRKPAVSLPLISCRQPRGIGTSMLLLLPRWAQPGDKSDLGRTQDCCPQCDDQGIGVPNLLGNFPRPSPNAEAPIIRFPRRSAGFQSHAAACSSRNDVRG